MDDSVFRLDDGDLMTVDAVLDRFENKVEVSGAVYRPGLYQLDGEVNTVKMCIRDRCYICLHETGNIRLEHDSLCRSMEPADEIV